MSTWCRAGISEFSFCPLITNISNFTCTGWRAPEPIEWICQGQRVGQDPLDAVAAAPGHVRVEVHMVQGHPGLVVAVEVPLASRHVVYGCHGSHPGGGYVV